MNTQTALTDTPRAGAETAFTGTVTAVRHAGRSRNGNPTYDVAFSDSSSGHGRILSTQRDAGIAYEVGPQFEGKPARITARAYRGELVIVGIELLSD